MKHQTEITGEIQKAQQEHCVARSLKVVRVEHVCCLLTSPPSNQQNQTPLNGEGAANGQKVSVEQFEHQKRKSQLAKSSAVVGALKGALHGSHIQFVVI